MKSLDATNAGAGVNATWRVTRMMSVEARSRGSRAKTPPRAAASSISSALSDLSVCVRASRQLAAGYTAFVADVGAGVSVTAGPHWQVRVDAGDLMVRYGQEAHRSNGDLTDGFTSHNLQVSSGLTWRF